MSGFRLPDLGEGLQEAEIVAWHVAVGDRVMADQPLLSVETDKAVVEIPSPQAGRIAALHGDIGEMVKIGALLVEFGEGTGAAPSVSVVGELPSAAPAPAPRRPTPAAGSRSTTAAVRAMPAVRQLAQRLGVDLGTLAGSGPDGAILQADVEAAAQGTGAVAGEPLRGLRRWMARSMTRAHAEVVPASVTELADIGDWPSGMEPMPRLVRAVCAGCAAEPALNAWYDGRRESRQLHDAVALGLAVDTADGLIVPVLRDADTVPPEDLEERLRLLRDEARARRLPPEDLRGATITLSNFGALTGRHAALVVVPPQVAILGAGRARQEAVVREGSIVARLLLPLSLTFDHRAVTGGEAARFLSAVIADLEKPA